MDKDNKDWKAIERIVTALERFITPNAKVEHDVWLPVLGSESESRQFDIVITVTNGNKITRFVVEVQDRGSKVEVNTFGGWIEKMQSVGAQHLICVSREGYPQSIFNKVKQRYGAETVTLMTLQDFDELTAPDKLKMRLSFDMTNKHYDIIEYSEPVVDAPAGVFDNFPLKNTTRIFMTADAPEPFSLKEIIENEIAVNTKRPEYLEAMSKNEPKNTGWIFFDYDKDSGLFVQKDGVTYKVVKWSFKILLTITQIPFDVETLNFTYHQEIRDDSLAWISSSKLSYNGKFTIINLIARIGIDGKPIFQIEEQEM